MTKKLEELRDRSAESKYDEEFIVYRDGFDRCYDKLMPVITELMAALEYYADRGHWHIEEDYSGYILVGWIDDDDCDKDSTGRNYYRDGGMRARTALAHAKEKLGL